jgi:hypothetical protein
MEFWCWIKTNHEVLQTIAAGVAAVGSVLGIFVAVFAWRAALASAESAKISANTSRMAERAYVSISHERPGLYFHPADMGGAGAQVRVQNYGRTPASIVKVVLTVWMKAELPDEPPYPHDSHVLDTPFFLSAGDHVILPYSHDLSRDMVSDIAGGRRQFWLLGYVDYIDTFGRQHRAGYARQFKHEARYRENNLVFVLKAGYNYDRER